ncbi:hypothetical protein ACDX78_19695 [Virgibacillus oceani]
MKLHKPEAHQSRAVKSTEKMTKGSLNGGALLPVVKTEYVAGVSNVRENWDFLWVAMSITTQILPYIKSRLL